MCIWTSSVNNAKARTQFKAQIQVGSIAYKYRAQFHCKDRTNTSQLLFFPQDHFLACLKSTTFQKDSFQSYTICNKKELFKATIIFVL